MISVDYLVRVVITQTGLNLIGFATHDFLDFSIIIVHKSDAYDVAVFVLAIHGGSDAK
ncbi:MAG: hypothetical protein BWX66_01885 [Deltaproteobacteria bacterium ADurb.Bin058]|nr:MAG: hypothetical protein BWX66_01885 [Deltaproteobacteria bacterium ADurb.Bin058]